MGIIIEFPNKISNRREATLSDKWVDEKQNGIYIQRVYMDIITGEDDETVTVRAATYDGHKEFEYVDHCELSKGCLTFMCYNRIPKIPIPIIVEVL